MQPSPSHHRVASLVACLPSGDAEQVLKRLPEGQAHAVRGCLASYGNPAPTRELALRRFLVDYADASEAKSRRPPQVPGSLPGPFAFLERERPSKVAMLLSRELPQVAAIVLLALPPVRAADVLALMTPDQQRIVVQRMATSQPTQRDVCEEIAESLAGRLIRS